jgi:hypothetical protein
MMVTMVTNLTPMVAVDVTADIDVRVIGTEMIDPHGHTMALASKC